MKRLFVCLLVSFLIQSMAEAGEVFLEAETFESSGGWTKVEGPAAKQASGLAMLGGASGAQDGTATASITIKDAGHYHLWVRYSSHPKWRGPFHVTALAGDRVLGDALFDGEFQGESARDLMTWRSFEVDLPEGPVTIRLSKHEHKNAGGIARLVDCLLLTMDGKLVPNHLNYGAQTYLRVTLGEGYHEPAYIHIFADHYHADWYQHYSLGKAGAVPGIAPIKTDRLGAGERTPWCNLTPMIYQDSGAMLHITARHAYTEYADGLRATFEFATAPDETSIVRTLTVDNRPGTVAIFTPPNLLTAENLALLKTDQEIADATGQLADAHAWPTHGKPLSSFPFFVSASIDNKFTPPDARVLARERKTLGYFGFTDSQLRHVGGAWLMKNQSYCQPDLEKMRAKFQRDAASFFQDGGKVENLVFCELTDEPTGQPLEACSADPAYGEAFRSWLRGLGMAPSDLLVGSWDEVKIVTGEQKREYPALYLYSQRFRTRALGDFMAVQRKLAEEAYGGRFPVLANFSDGAVYGANFCLQGVDYFELLDSPDQNAIWGEDWANGASSYQCAAFNVDLMRAAARERGQVIAHHLVAHAGRKSWDIKLKATSEVARGVKIFNNFCYGPTWATHEGGPYWRSHVWQGKPETWTANAAITREIGAVEDLLLPAMPAPAEVALLYSSSSDAWTVDRSFASGFDRMHTWMALAHAQVPVDVVAERQVERDCLKAYRVCYLSGPNLTRAAAEKLKDWVRAGGTLWLTAGAAERDEFDRPMAVLDGILPAKRGPTEEFQPFRSSGRYLATLTGKDTVAWKEGQAQVLSVRQPLEAMPGAETIATFQDGSPALVRGGAGKGTVFCAGFLPALSYIKPALEARNLLQKKVDEGTPLAGAEVSVSHLLERSSNPWQFPDAVRDLILGPARQAGVRPPVGCSQPLVDAPYLPGDKGILIPLANYTLQPIEELALRIAVTRPVARVESVLRGEIAFTQPTPREVRFSLPLDNNDFVVLRFH
ncbi:MAG: beta-galactosidase trimerization domain-containing protein [Verrucomicrobiae bacterium]|nr:beta-galactosidase trimerization domain-containing protein [Verrucomicrobiae bacterium]